MEYNLPNLNSRRKIRICSQNARKIGELEKVEEKISYSILSREKKTEELSLNQTNEFHCKFFQWIFLGLESEK